MPRRTKDAPGRVTPKGGSAGRRSPRSNGGAAARATSGRYTAPVPREYRSSPRWYPYFVLALFLIGVGSILLNYLSLLPGFGGASNVYLFIGLGVIVLGFVAATRWH